MYKKIILSIHYHKTGHELSKKLYKIYNKHLDNCICHIKDPISIKKKFKYDKENKFIYPIINFKREKKYNIYNNSF